MYTKTSNDYQLKASGPLLDRLDFVLTLKNVGLQQDETAKHLPKLENEQHALGKCNDTLWQWSTQRFRRFSAII